MGEEGLDIPECNLVVRYGLLTNEIAQLQAIGRARAKNSQYSVVAEEGGREVNRERTNEILEELMVKAISQIQRMSPEDFRIKVRLHYHVQIHSEIIDAIIFDITLLWLYTVHI